DDLVAVIVAQVARVALAGPVVDRAVDGVDPRVVDLGLRARAARGADAVGAGRRRRIEGPARAVALVAGRRHHLALVGVRTAGDGADGEWIAAADPAVAASGRCILRAGVRIGAAVALGRRVARGGLERQLAVAAVGRDAVGLGLEHLVAGVGRLQPAVA